MNNEIIITQKQFDEVIPIINNARTRAMRAVNAELIDMYWEIGVYISEKVKIAGWGGKVLSLSFQIFCKAIIPRQRAFPHRIYGE